jgi:general secretion pathway protein D
MGVEIGAPTSPTSTTNGILAHQGTSDGTDKYGVLHSLLGLATEAGTKGFTYRILNRKETFNLLGYILSTQENSKVLSTPKVLTSNNEESHITVGQEIPVIQSSVTDVVNNITTVNFKYENVGLQLKVTPRISQDDFVNMKVHAELKDLSPKTLFDASIINTREADATVIVPDNYTVILGGLMRNNDAIVEDKVPFLGDIPLLGNLFKKTKTTSLKTELLIFLTPHIIKSKEDLQKITEPSKNKMDLITEALDAGQLKKAIKEVVTQPAQDAAPKKKKEKKNAGQKTKKLTNAGS